MKKVQVIILILSLSLVSSAVLAQQASAPTPTSAAPAFKVQDPAVPLQMVPAPAMPSPAVPKTPSPAAPTPAAEIDAPGSNFTISRMEIAGSIENREPVGIAATYPASQEKVSCFVELNNVLADTSITFVWWLGANQIDSVTQQVKSFSRWRTWSNKSINGMKGDWKVDVLDETGAVLRSATFAVE